MNQILTDIVGTTTPCSFIEVLMNRFKEKGPGFIGAALARADEEIHDAVEKTRAENPTRELDYPWQIVAYVAEQLAQKKLNLHYLTLTGRVNLLAYGTEFKAPVFDDVPVAFKRWYDAGKGISVYSNGIPDEQRFIFGNTDHGDLKGRIRRYFGTNDFGMKNNPESYKRISDALGNDPNNIMFLSDSLAELDAAHAANYGEVILLDRPGNKPVKEKHNHRVERSFDNIN